MSSGASLFVEIHLSTKKKRAKCVKKRHIWKISFSVFPRLFKENVIFLLFFTKRFFEKVVYNRGQGPRQKFLATPGVLTVSSSKMILGSGGFRSVIFGLFSIFDLRNFDHLGKNVFGDCHRCNKFLISLVFLCR